MSLEFIIGPCGSGKTTSAFSSIIETSMSDHRACLVIVPEQFTLQTQADIARLHPRHGTMDIDVLSFERLAWLVFEEIGVPEPVLIDDLGKLLLLRHVTDDVSDGLHALRAALKKPGSLEKLKSLLSELGEYRVDSSRLKELSEAFASRPLLSEKLSDLAEISAAFHEALSENTIPKEDMLHFFSRYISQSQILKGSCIVLDGFTGFTPNQCEVIGELLRVADRITVTLPLGSGLKIDQTPSQDHIFSRSRYTYDQLLRLAAEAGVKVKDPEYTGTEGLPRFANAPALAFLEAHFGRFNPLGTLDYPTEGQIQVTEASSPSEEAEYIAACIRTTVREKGLRWRDIAVVCSDLGTYRRHIERAFGVYGIPAFIDSNRSLDQNPFGSYVIALTGPSEDNFSFDSIFRLLKSRFSGVTQEDCDLLENYALACGIRGRQAWERAWADESIPEIVDIKKKSIQPYLNLSEHIKGRSHTVSEILHEIMSFLEETACEEKLKTLADELDQEGEYSLAIEFSMLWDLTKDLFVRIDTILGDTKASADEVRDLIEAGFQEMKAGVIPAGIDTVLVGDISRSRIGDIKLLFFAGMNDGLVPSGLAGSSILSEIERDHLRNAGIELRPGPREDSFLQKLRVYQTLTRPREKLSITYSRFGNNGKAVQPSPWLKDITALCSSLTIRDAGEFISREGITASIVAARLSMARSMRQLPDSSDPMMLYAWFLRNEGEREFIERLAHARTFRYDPEQLDPSAVKLLLNGSLSGSASVFESYASCPFGWFLKYGLRLRERKIYGLDSRDLGTLLHSTVENYFIHMREEGFGWTQSDDERHETVSLCVDEALALHGYEIFSETHRDAGLAVRLMRAADRAVWALIEQGKRGDYLPEDTELAFTAQNTDAFNIRLQDDWVLRLNGRIDRLDTFSSDGNILVKVIDYKSGRRELEPALIYNGIEIQLPLYLHAAVELEEKKHPFNTIIPAGIGYFTIVNDYWLNDSDEYGSDPDKLDADALSKMNMSAMINTEEDIVQHMDRGLADGKDSVILGLRYHNDELKRSTNSGTHISDTAKLRRLMAFSREKAAAIGRSIVSGDIKVSPYSYSGRDACKYCPYGSVCGFSTKAGYKWNKIPAMKDEDLWDSI